MPCCSDPGAMRQKSVWVSYHFQHVTTGRSIVLILQHDVPTPLLQSRTGFLTHMPHDTVCLLSAKWKEKETQKAQVITGQRIQTFVLCLLTRPSEIPTTLTQLPLGSAWWCRRPHAARSVGSEVTWLTSDMCVWETVDHAAFWANDSQLPLEVSMQDQAEKKDLLSSVSVLLFCFNAFQLWRNLAAVLWVTERN